MKRYAAIDRHANNGVLVILDERDRTVLQRRLPNHLEQICQALCAHREAIEGLAVESTYNGYGLVDGLMEAGYRLHLVNTTAVPQYDGMKYREDTHDARWLAQLLRLGILPEGSIYPKAERGLRDLMRKRSQRVRARSQPIVSVENALSREVGTHPSSNRIQRWQESDVDDLPLAELSPLAVKSNLAVMHLPMNRVNGWKRPSWPRQSSARSTGACSRCAGSARCCR